MITNQDKQNILNPPHRLIGLGDSYIEQEQFSPVKNLLSIDDGDITNSDEENTVKLIQDSMSLQKILQESESDTVAERKFIQRSSNRHQQKAPMQFDKFETMFSIEGPIFVLSRKGTFKLWNAKLKENRLTLSQETKSRYFNFNQINAKADLFNEEIILTIKIFDKKEKQIHFKVGGKISLEEWFQVLNYQIKSTDEDLKKDVIPKIPKFWKDYYISSFEFEKMANSLDLMLFKSNSIPAQIQRVVTNSEYDHVAMILRSSKDEVYLFDSNSEDGVGLSLWSSFKEDIRNFNGIKIAYRKIEIERSEERIINLQNFIRKSCGKKFSIGLIKLLKKRSMIHSHEDQERTYFCSELVAAALKSVNLLPPEKACTQYWPKDFAQKNSLQLLQNAIISHEMIINFDL